MQENFKLNIEFVYVFFKRFQLSLFHVTFRKFSLLFPSSCYFFRFLLFHFVWLFVSSSETQLNFDSLLIFIGTL